MRRFEVVRDDCRKTEGNIILPTRSDKGSAGYDFYSAIDFEIKPGETKLIPTDVKAKMLTNEVLLLFVRSSIGIKKHIVLANGTGVIDSTYYSNPDNDGNICGAFTNIGTETQVFKAGDRIMQGVFLEYLTTVDDKPVNAERTGGIGSSGV
jgi:dUTP pyrophosphatase